MSSLEIFLLINFIILYEILNLLYFHKLFKSYQLKLYYLCDTIKTFELNLLNTILLEIIVFFNGLLIFIQNKTFIFIALFLNILISYLFCFKFKEKKQKNKLIYTKRFIRFYILFVSLSLLLLSFIFLLFKTVFWPFILINSLILNYFVFMLAHILILPIENVIKNGYIKKAKKKLKECKNLKVIAITGSFGKTSVKNFIYQILKTKFKVCMSPNSFNTDMGITKTILNYLKLDDEFLILEMGADRLHDINKLCKIVKPDYSILTGVTNQHLNTFKTFDNIVSTKYELVQNTKGNGFIVFNGENKITKEFYDKTTTANKVLVGNKKFFAKDIECSLFGTTFTLVHHKKQIIIKTKLLGRHNVINLLLASRLAVILGFSLDDIKFAIEKIEQVEHRLNLIENNGKYILDDSFNANSEGVKRSIEVLKSHSGKKIVITGGIVELGKDSYKENYNLGVLMQDIDFVIITNKINRTALLDGLNRENNVFVVENLIEAVEKLQEIYFVGDCVLFLNDLPDSYK